MTMLPRVAQRLFGRPLLVDPQYAGVVVSVLADRLGVQPMVSAEMADRYRRPNDRPVLHKDKGLVVYPVVGSMVHRGDGVDADSGLQSYTAMQRELTALLDDPSVRGILLDLDTPGGEAAGLVELSEWVRQAKGEKPIWAIANTSATSAGYWLGASADKLFAAPMSSVGSIGVLTMHVDMSKAVEKRGLVHTLVFAGQHKVDGNPFEPLPEAVKANVQGHIDQLYAQFTAAVADMRGVDEAVIRSTEAKVYGPEEALSLGLIDGTGTLGQVLKAFHEELTRPSVPGATLGFAMTNPATSGATFSQADLDRARAEGHSAGVQAGIADERARVSQIMSAPAAADRPQMAAKLVARGVDAETAVDLLSTAPAEKAAAAAPTAPAAANRSVEALLAGAAPQVRAEEVETDPKAARLAELQKAGRTLSVSRGYTAAR